MSFAFSIGKPPIAVSLSITRIYLYGLSEICDSFVILALPSSIGKPPIAVGVSMPWIYLYDFGEIRDGLV